MAFIIITFSISSEAINLKEYKNSEIIIQYEPPIENAAINLSGVYRKVKTVIEKKLRWKVEFIPTTILIHKRTAFQKMAQNELVTAFALPGENSIVIDYSKMERTPFDLTATFTHEVCHLVLHHNIKEKTIPKWLDEGVCQWASGGIADIINPGEKDILKQAVLSDNLFALKEIAFAFPEQQRGLLLAYEESKSFVEFVVHEYGTEKLLSVLNSLKKGTTIEQAVQENLSVELTVLEQKWQKSLIRQYSWFSYIADHLYWILFFAAAIVTLIGYLKFRRKLRNYKDDGEETG
ncbi:MAG: peptidase MA family metallohydrolase [Nitrospirota bacterium]|nr:peptidase MA family metallohydrolase [Nitrospirota bacterium]MDH5767660.1 peptidase MA family metallohydrolase [Nitrospirota bacterium]